jgi:hypothetical protein
MSGGNYERFGNIIDYIQPELAEDFTDYAGHVVYNDSGTLELASLTDQATTDALVPLGVVTKGASTWAHLVIVDTGEVMAIAGTGGVSAGDNVGPEYSATAANRGRLINRATADIADNDFIVGTAKTAASAGGTFVLTLNIRKVPVPA